jgi:hypothetical protein
MSTFSPRRRIIAAIVLLIGLFNAANYYFALGFFGRFGKQVYGFTPLFLVLFAIWLGAFSLKHRRKDLGSNE